jgi:hypothetical protein
MMTIGSPVGLDEIQDKLQPGCTRADEFPRENVRGVRIKVFDRPDPVAGFDPFWRTTFERVELNLATSVPIIPYL